MAKLTPEAKIHLGIIHQCDVHKVLRQIEIIESQNDEIEELKDFSKEECKQLVLLLDKYHKILKSIKSV